MSGFLLANQGQHSWLCISASLLALMPIVGCSSTPVGSVMGQVTFVGKPLDDAVILFRPTGGENAGGAQAKIEGGSYKIDQVPAGEYSVWILAERKTGRKVPVLDVEPGQKRTYDEERVQVIPIRYNARTGLHATIEAGENQHDFDLTK